MRATLATLAAAVIAALTVTTPALAHPPGLPHYRELMAIARCETGGLNGGRPLWTHQNSEYGGALGFRHATWSEYRRERQGKRVGMPLYAWNATPRQQLLVGEVLIRTFEGYSSWPGCSAMLGLR